MKKSIYFALAALTLAFFACTSKPAESDQQSEESQTIEAVESVAEEPASLEAEEPLAEEPLAEESTEALAEESPAEEQPVEEQPAEQPAEEPVDEEETVFLIVDKMPVPPFDKNEMVNELAKWLDDVDPEANDCRVMVRMVVEKNGKVTHPEVLRSSGYEKVDAYALKRVLEKMPKFKEPAMKGGQPCRAYFTVPVYFKKKS